MPKQISRLVDLRQSLRQAAGDFCDSVERNEESIDPNDVEKVRYLIESASASLDATPIFFDVISTKLFLASKKTID